MSKSNRTLELINSLNLNPRSFAIEIGFNQASTIYNIIKRKSNPSKSTLDKICKRFPHVNREWLVTGFGNMFKNSTTTKDDFKVNNKGTLQPSQRLKYLIDSLGMNINSFSKECGYTSSTTIWRIINDNKKPSTPTLDNICNRFPKVNREWLLTGLGSMFLNQFSNDDITVTAKQVLDKVLPQLKIMEDELYQIKKKLREIE